jgi:uncharacterized protein YndB with AHSA1/START domain
MDTLTTAPAAGERQLVLDRHLAAPRAKLWRCWTEPDLLVRWFTPAPWKTVRAELDLRPGGASRVVMESPEGEQFPSRGVYLAVEPERRLVFTDAFVEAWIPSDRPFFVAEVTFADEGAGTRYRAVARHWTAEARAEHEAMGFHEGWNKAANQLEALAKAL